MLSANGLTAKGDMKYWQRWLGSQGWNTGGAAARDGSCHMIWFDVSPFFAKRPTDTEFLPLCMPGKVPQHVMNYGGGQDGQPGSTGGGWWGGFGGPDSQVCYIIVATGLYVSSDFLTGRNFTATAFGDTQVTQGGKIVDPNRDSRLRTWANKGATDPINRDVCYFNFAQYGHFRTLDRGVTVTPISWLPLPTHRVSNPDFRWGIIAVDEDGPTTGGPNNRKARVADSPAGTGIWLSTDGMDSGTKISTTTGPGKIDAVSTMKWIGGKLYVCVVGKDEEYYNETVSAATGGAGTGNVAKCDNIRVYDPSTGNWSIVAHGASNVGFNSWWQNITPDPRYPGVGYFAWAETGEVMHTNDGTTFTYQVGNGYVDTTRNLRLHPFGRMVPGPNPRPAVAAKYRFEGIGFAISDPVVVPQVSGGSGGAKLVAHLGFGPVETNLADWPAQSATSGTDPLDPVKLPLWREITAGAEAKVGQCSVWLDGKLWNGAQDVSVAGVEDGSRGHLATVYTFPQNGSLSDALDMARGHVSGFGVVRRIRSGTGPQSGVAGNSYTVDNKKWIIAPNQPPNPKAGLYGADVYISGGIACGAGYSAVDVPAHCGIPGIDDPSYDPNDINVSLVPTWTSDIRSQPWVPITFKKGSTTIPMRWDGRTKFNGFQGGPFSNVHKLVAVDPDNPSKYYFWNLGGATAVDQADPNGPTGWVYDPADVGGIYMMDVSDGTGVANQVYSAKVATGYGSPQRFSNFGSLDTTMLIAAGYMILASNYLPNGPAGYGNNKLVVLNMATWERRVLTDGPANFTSLDLGDPLYGTLPCLWGFGWSQGGVFGLWYSHNWNTASPTWEGPFNATMPTAGFPGRISAHLAIGSEKKQWGRIGVSLKTRGLAEGRFQLG